MREKKLQKRNKIASKKFRDEVTPTNFDAIIIFLNSSWFAAIRTSDSVWMIIILAFSLMASFYLIKAENKTKQLFKQNNKKLFWCLKCSKFLTKIYFNFLPQVFVEKNNFYEKFLVVAEQGWLNLDNGVCPPKA